MSDRRTFLRGLVSLPLIGGGVTLLGNPTAAAVPVTDAMLRRYVGWLAHEHVAAVHEYRYREAFAGWIPGPDNYDASAEAYATRVAAYNDHMMWMADPDRTGIEGTAGLAEIVKATKPSSRAAVVLSAVGCPLTGGAHD